MLPAIHLGVVTRTPDANIPEIEFQWQEICPFLVAICEDEALPQDELDSLFMFYSLDVLCVDDAKTKSLVTRLYSLAEQVASGTRSRADADKSVRVVTSADPGWAKHNLPEIIGFASDGNPDLLLGPNVAQRILEFFDKHSGLWKS